MECLLTILSNITTYSTKHSFTNLCWYSLSKVIGSKTADEWNADQRNRFIAFTRFFITCGDAVFTVKDALLRDNVANLNSRLISELVEPLDRMEEFASSVEIAELNTIVDEYTEILLNMEKRMVDTELIEFAANYFKIFFLTVHALRITERINILTDNSHS